MVWTRKNDGSWPDHFRAWLTRVHPDVAGESGLVWSVVEDLYEAEFDAHAQVANACGYPILDEDLIDSPDLSKLGAHQVRYDKDGYACREPLSAVELAEEQAAWDAYDAELAAAAEAVEKRLDGVAGPLLLSVDDLAVFTQQRGESW